jgi:hypothetical protein
VNKDFIKEISNIAVIAGWLFNSLCLLGKFSSLFSLIAGLGMGIGALIFLLNIIALVFLVINVRKCRTESYFARNLLLIVLFLVVYPLIFNQTRSLV